MLGITFSEIAVIMVVALIVIGPQKMPEVIKTVGKMVGKLRYFTEKVRRDIEEEFKVDELRKSFNSITKDNELNAIKKELTTVTKETEEAMRLAEDRFKNALSDNPIKEGIDSFKTALPQGNLLDLSPEEIAESSDSFQDPLNDFSDYYASEEPLITKAPKNYQSAIHEGAVLADIEHPDDWQALCHSRQLALALEEDSPAFIAHQLISAQNSRVILSEEAIYDRYVDRTEALNQITLL